MRLELSKCVIRSLEMTDARSIVEHLNNHAVWVNLTDLIPYPYTRGDADRWLTKVVNQTPPTNFSITVNDEFVGVIGFESEPHHRRHCAEIGYWLGQDYWGRGIATDALRARAFEREQIRRR